MAGLREFRETDAEAVAALYEQVARSGQKHAAPALVSYFVRIFLDTPFAEKDCPSFVYEDASGTIVGFVGVQSRQFIYQGKQLRALVSGPLFVDPGAGVAGAGLLLLRAVNQLPHDLLLTDGANPEMRRIWQRLIGYSNELAAFHWHFVFRRARHGLRRLAARPRLKRITPLLRALEPLVSLADRALHTIYVRRLEMDPGDLIAEPLTAESLCAARTQLSGNAILRPSQDVRSAQWLLDELRKIKRLGRLHVELLTDRRGKAAGLYILFLQSGGESRVVHFAAAPDHASAVLNRLLAVADRAGSVSVTGRVEPAILQYVAPFGVDFRYGRMYSLISSKVPELDSAILSGRADLSWLDGESWMGFPFEDF